jgi:Icc-related predicted phosphoesterase
MGLTYSAPLLEPFNTTVYVPQRDNKIIPVFKGGRVACDDVDGKSQESVVRFVCTSDTHNQHERFHMPDGDVFIHCGDFSCHETSAHGDVAEFNRWLGTLPHRYKIVVSGNHDCGLTDSADENRRMLSNATYYLQDETVELDNGVRIHGSPWHHQRPFWYKANQFAASSRKLEQQFAQIPEDIDVLVTHVPPTQCELDMVGDDCSVGSVELARHSLQRVKPAVHVFGHNHTYNDPKAGARIVSHETHDTLLINTAQRVVVFDYHR